MTAAAHLLQQVGSVGFRRWGYGISPFQLAKSILLKGIENKSDTLILNPNYVLEFIWFYLNQTIWKLSLPLTISTTLTFPILYLLN